MIVYDRKWQERTNIMNGVGTVFSVSVSYMLLLSIMFSSLIGQLQQAPRQAEAATCSLSATISTTIELTPLSGDNIIDCSGQDIVVTSTGKLIIKSYKVANTQVTDDTGVLLKVGSLTVQSGGEITADGQGYVAGDTDGGSALVSTGIAGGSGGGHGGAGGIGNESGGLNVAGTPGSPYGNKDTPLYLGGAGGTSGVDGYGGAGGGAIHIQSSGTVTIDGVITANGVNGSKSTDGQTAGGGGAGGSVYIEAAVLAGNGQVSAHGGGTDRTAGYFGGGGGGGRIAILCTTSTTFPATNVNISFGTGSQDGQPGSLVGPGCIPPAPSILKFYEKAAVATQVDRELAVGELTTHTALTFAGDLVGENLKLEIEIRERNQQFLNVRTGIQDVVASNKLCTNVPTGNGVPLTAYCGFVEVTTLLEVSKEYKWQARVVSADGISSAWVAYGGNADTAADFIVVGAPVSIVKVEGDNQTAVVGQSVAVKPKIRVVDAIGYGVPFYSINAWQVVTGGGTALAAQTTMDKWGEGTVEWALGNAAGVNNNTIQAYRSSFPALAAVTFTASAVPGAIASYAVNTTSTVIETGSAFSYQVVAKDMYENTVPFAGSLTAVPVMANDSNVPASGTLSPDILTVPVDGTTSSYNVAGATYSFSENIKIKVYDANGHVGYSNSLLFVPTLGSCPAVTIDISQTWNAIDAPGGIYNCRGLGVFTVKAGAELSFVSYNNGDGNITNDYGVTLLVDSLVVEATGEISANGTGYAAGQGNGDVYGGYGNNGGIPYGNVYNPDDLGSGGDYAFYGTAGAGGGSIKILSLGDASLEGRISANGTDGSGIRGDGGAGGSIWLDVAALSGNGTIRTNGGYGVGDPGGGGSGGRIALFYSQNNGFTLSGTAVQSYGGSSSNHGTSGPGTVYLEQKGVDNAENGVLLVDNNGNSGNFAAVTSGIYQFKQIKAQRYGNVEFMDAGGMSELESDHSRLSLSSAQSLVGDSTKPQIKVSGVFAYTGGQTLTTNGVDLGINGKALGVDNLVVGTTMPSGLTLYAKTWFYNNASPYTFSSLDISPEGIVTMVTTNDGPSVYGNDYGVNLVVSSFNLSAGGIITSDGYGYGAGVAVSGDVHGGYSRNGGGTPYGNVYEPTTLGSGGDYGYYGTPGAGGGAVKITVNGSAVVNGTITVNGLGGSGNKYDGGAAGSIWFNTETLSGSGIMRANGGTGAWDPGNGGSGGRIALYYTTNNGFPLEGTNIQAFGGPGANGYAGPGTVYIEQKGTDVLHQGTLLVDNNNYAGLFAGVPHGEYAFKQIKTTRKGHVEFMDVGGASADELVHSHLTISSGAGMVGDTTRPQIKVSGLLTYTGAGLLTIDGVDLGLNGKVVGVNDITVGATMPSGLTLYAKTWYNNAVNGYTFGNLTLTGNATMTMVTYNDGPSVYTNDYGVNLTVSALNLATGGVITSDGYGYASWSAVSGSGDAHGGYSRNGGRPYGSVYEPATLGSGGDYGFYGTPGPGGGSMKLTVNGDTVLNGTITVNGVGGSGNKYDGGAGGSVWLNTEGISGTGIIRANGGPGNWDPGNGGSGGRIAVYYTTNNGFTLDGTKLQAYGGPGSWGYGGAGTIYLEQKNTDVVHQGILLVDNNNYAGISAGVPHGDYTFKQINVARNGHVEMMDNGGNSAVDADHSQLTISSGSGMVGDATKPLIKVSGVLNYTGGGILTLNGVDLGINGKSIGVSDITVGASLASGLTLYAKTWYYNATNQHVFGNLVINGNGIVTVDSEDNGATSMTDDYGVTLNLTGLNIATGGKITGDYLGYAKWSAVARSSHGGFAGGTPYGSVYEPTTLGSGGTDAFYGDVGAGGAALKLVVSGTTTHNGLISMNGQNGSGNRGDAGAGGSVWLDTDILTGTGTIQTNGGSGVAYYGGSGGRIAVYYNTNNGFVTDGVHLQSFGGPGGTGYVGPGTVYIENKGVDTSHQGQLLVDNASHDGASAGLSSADYVFQQITLSRFGHVEVLGQNSRLTVANAASLVGDTSKPLLKISGTLNYTSTDPLVVNGIDLGINGKIESPNNVPVNVTVGDTLTSELTLFAKGWFYNKTNPIVLGNLVVMGNGTIDMVSNTNATSTFTDDEGVYLSTETLNVATGGRIHADGRGYPEDNGPGAGGAHGGYVTNAPTILPQGSFYEPTMLGSGGGWGFYGTPGDGGGAMKITVNSAATINGTISADATYGGGNAFGGAAGGSIWLNVGTISGSGILRANGSNGAGREAGSGGRIAVYFQDNAGFTFDATHTQTLGGAGASGYGGPGTIYTEAVGVHRTKGGNLSILNNAHAGRGQDFEAGTYELNDLTIGQNVSVWVKSDLTAVSDPLGLVAPHELQADDSTVGLFHFSEAGSSFADASGNGHSASAQNNVLSTTNGKFGGAQYVNNTNIGINFEQIALPGDWSADMWVKFPLPGTVDGWRTLMHLNGTSYHNIIVHANGQLGAYNDGWYDSGYNVNSLTGWHHLAVVASGTSTHYYIDGTDVGSIPIAMHTNVNIIGSAGSSQNAGYIDEVRLQSKAMTSQEILAAANATEAYQTTTDTLALWHLDEELNYGGDSSAQGVVAVQIGTITTVDGKFGKGRELNATGEVIRTSPITIGSDWTIDMWSNFPLPATNTWRSLAARSIGTYHHIMVNNVGKLGTYNNGWYDSGYSISSLTGWHHVAAVGSGTQTKFYIDGVYVSAVNTKITEPVSAFGNTESAPYHTGLLDELRVRTRALTEAEILAEVTSGVQQSNDADTVYFNHLNEPLQNVTADSKVGNAAATLFGTGSMQGKYGLSRSYAGLNDYIQLPPTTYDFSQGMTFSFWAKPTASPSYARFVDFGNASSSDNILIFRMGTSNNFGVQIFRGASSPTYLEFANVIINNEWHLYTVTQNATGTVTAYRDGVVVGTGTLQTPLTVQRNLNYVGKSHWGDAFYQGSIDELQIHNRALSEEEIKASFKGLSLLEYQEYQQNLVGKGVQFDLTGDFTLATGAQILGTGVGFPTDNGQGRGSRGIGYSGGAGGANGGDGGDGQSDGQNAPAQGGTKYGNQLLPVTLGAGGGSSGAGKAGGSGGGSLVVLAHGVQNAQGVYEKGNILIDGSIIMDGTIGLIGSPGGGGGSGGSILLHGNTCSVNGTLSAVGGAGGNSDVDGGNGGGGRISVLYNVGPCSVGGTVNYGPGIPADPLNFSAFSGQSGTFPPEPNSVPWAPQYKEQFELKETSSALNTRLAKVNAESSSVLGISESAIPVGGIINGTTVTLKADAYDAGARAVSPKGLKIQVELKKVGQNFDGVTNLYESALVSFSGGQPLVLSVTISNLEMGASYKWRVRTVNVDNSLLSDWREYGDNNTDAADFSITTVAAIELGLEKSSMDLSEYSSITVLARNSLGDIDTSYRGTVSFRSSSDTAQLPVNYTFTAGDNGQHTFVNGLKFFETGTFTVTVEDTVNPSLVGTGSITVTVPQIPFISIGASATTINRGESTVVSWVSNYMTNLSIDQNIGDVSAAGSQEVSPTETTTYTIIGYNSQNEQMTASVTITVDIVTTTVVTTTMLVTRIPSTPPITTIITSDTPTLTPTSTPPTTRLVITPPPLPVCPIISNFSVSEILIKKDRMFEINWAVSQADKVAIDLIGSNLPASGSVQLSLKDPREATLLATKGTCQRKQTVHIEVVNAYPWEGAGGALVGLFVAEAVTLQMGIAQGNIWFALAGMIDNRKKRTPWGVAYNSVTKKLVSRVIIRLWDAESGKLVDTVVADANGIFKLTPKKGKYIIKAVDRGYIFPSKLVQGNIDSGYTNIYKGEVIEITSDKQILMISIPLDPVKNSGVNQIQRILSLSAEVVALVSPIVLIGGFVYSVVVTIMYPLALNYAILGLYALAFAAKMYVYLSKPKLFGTVTDVEGNLVSGLELGLFDKEFDNVVARTFTNKKGEYNFVVQNKEYYMKLMDSNYRMLHRSNVKEGLPIHATGTRSNVRLVTENLMVYSALAKEVKKAR